MDQSLLCIGEGIRCLRDGLHLNMKEGSHPLCIREEPALPLMNSYPEPHAAGRRLQQTPHQCWGTRSILIHVPENKPWSVARSVVVGLKLLIQLGLATRLVNRTIRKAHMAKQL